MMARTPASTSLDMEALGNMEVRMDWRERVWGAGLSASAKDDFLIYNTVCVCVCARHLAVLDVVSQSVNHRSWSSFGSKQVQIIQSLQSSLRTHMGHVTFNP